MHKYKYNLLYCFDSGAQARDVFIGTKSELDKYIQSLKSKGCYGFDIEMEK